MSERIAMRYTVALQGFSEFERDTLASCFRLDTARAPSYGLAASLQEADFVVADADHPAAVAAVLQARRAPDAVFVGARRPPGAGAHLPRPIAPTAIVRELDGLMELRLASFDDPGSGDWLLSTPGPLGAGAGAAGVTGAGGAARDVLVVDDSRIALRFLQVRLQSLGYRVHVAQTSAQALQLLAEQPLALVFLDVVLAEGDAMDGLQLCRLIKQHAGWPGPVPKVVLTTGQASASDRVMGALAGCDAYLSKPLMMDEFTATLRQLQPRAAA